MRSPISLRPAKHRLCSMLAPTVLFFASALAPLAPLCAQDIITTIAGGGLASDPLHVGIGAPQAVAIGPDGTLYWSATARIMHRKGDGHAEIVAGNGSPTLAGDGGPATAGSIAFASGLAVAANGDLFISDPRRVRKVTAATGVISTVAGGGASSLDGVAATAATLLFPQGLAVNAAGDLFVADQNDHRVRRVDATSGLITTVAGNGTAPISGPNGEHGDRRRGRRCTCRSPWPSMPPATSSSRMPARCRSGASRPAPTSSPRWPAPAPSPPPGTAAK